MAFRRAHKRRSDNPPARIADAADGIRSATTALSSAPADLPEELIAERAYEKWRLRGCPMGQDGEQDWYAARAELEAERTTPQAGDDKRSAGK